MLIYERKYDYKTVPQVNVFWNMCARTRSLDDLATKSGTLTNGIKDDIGNLFDLVTKLSTIRLLT